MPAAKKEIIIDFTVLNKDALKVVSQTTDKINNLKKVQADLKARGMENSEVYAQNAAVLNELNVIMRANQKELENNLRMVEAEEGSLEQMRVVLKSLIKEYETMGEAQRESAEGEALLQQIDAQRVAVEDLEHKLGDWRRQVGNYGKAMESMAGPVGKVIGVFKKLSGGTLNLASAFKNGITAVKAFSKQLLKLMTNPIVALIAAIVAALKLLVDQFKKNDQAMTALEKVFAAFKPILDLVNKGIQAIVGVLAKAAEGIASFVSKVMSVIPGVKDYVAAEQDMVDSTDKLQDAKRNYVADEAKRNRQIAELNNKAAQSDKYTYKQRRQFMEQAIALEKQNMEQKRQIAKEELRLAQQEAALAIGAKEYSEEIWDRLSDEVKDHLKELEAAVDNVEAEFEDGTRRMESRRSNFNKQEAAEWRAYRKNRRDAEIALQDELLKNYDDTFAAQYAKFITTSRKEIAELKEQLNDADSKLDAKARQSIKERIKVIEDSYARVSAKMSEAMTADYGRKRADEEIRIAQSLYDKTIENTKERYDAETVLMKQHFDREQVEYELHIRELKLLLDEVNADLSQDEATMKKKAESAGLSLDDYKRIMNDRKVELEEALKTENKLKTDNEVKFNNEQKEREWRHQEDLKKIRLDIAKTMMDTDIQKQLNAAEVLDEEKKQEMIARIQEEAARKRLEIAKGAYDEMKNMSDEDIKYRYGTYEAYNLAMEQAYGNVIKLEGDYEKAVKATTNALLQQQTKTINSYNQIAKAIGSAMASMESMFSEMAEDNSKMADFATALAIMQIEVSTAVSVVEAIAAATKAGSSFGVLAPAMIPVFIAELVGIVMANIASTVSTLKKAKAEKPSTPRFWHGGMVGNETTNRTDDTVTAKLSLGEYVIRSKRVKELGVDYLDYLNYGTDKPAQRYTNLRSYAEGGYVDKDSYGQMKMAFSEALEEMPNPIVGVKEFTDVQRRVEVKENISR